MRTTFSTMGTVASLVVPSPGLASGVEKVFERADATFSLYRDQSELSRIARGDLSMMDASEEIREAYASAVYWRDRTDGAFSPNRPDGVIDLNGVVKARAIANAGDLLRAAGADDWSINVGGDVLTSGHDTDGSQWSVGVVDPDDRLRLLCAIDLSAERKAIATSGSAERGDHIWRGGSADVPEYVQVSVLANDIVTADVLATAIVAGGHTTLTLLTERFDVDVFTVGRTGELLATPGFRTALASPSVPIPETHTRQPSRSN